MKRKTIPLRAQKVNNNIKNAVYKLGNNKNFLNQKFTKALCTNILTKPKQKVEAINKGSTN